MNFNQAFYTAIFNNASTPDRFYYGSAVGSEKPFYTMLPLGVADVQPVSMCETQGGQGVSNYQFSLSGGVDAGDSETLLIGLNTIVSDILGEISYNDGIEYKYDIWNNITTGVTVLGGVDLNTWDAVFECQVWWKRTQ